MQIDLRELNLQLPTNEGSEPIVELDLDDDLVVTHYRGIESMSNYWTFEHMKEVSPVIWGKICLFVLPKL